MNGSRRRRWLRWTWRVVTWTAVLIVLAGIGFTVYVVILNRRGRAAVAHVQAQLQQRHLPWHLAGLKIPIASASSDATRTYRAAFALRGIVWDPAATKGLPVFDVDEPKPGVPVSAAMRDQLTAFVASNKTYYDLLDRAATQPVGSYFEGDLTHVMSGWGWSILLGPARNAARMLAVRSLLHQARHQDDAALADLGDILRLSASFQHDPLLIISLIRISLNDLMMGQLQDALSRTQPSLAALERLRRQCLDPDVQPDRVMTMEAELLWASDLLRKVSTHGLAILGLSFAPPTSDRLWSALCPGAYQLDILSSVEDDLTLYDAAKLPDAQLARQLLKQRNTAAGLPVPEQTMATLLRSQADMNVAATALAVEAYRIAHGQWPPSLSSLGDGARPDPYTGSPLRYVHQADGSVVIYSVGNNLADDGPGNDIDQAEFRLLPPQARGRTASSQPATRPTTIP